MLLLAKFLNSGENGGWTDDWTWSQAEKYRSDTRRKKLTERENILYFHFKTLNFRHNQRLHENLKTV